MEQVCVHCGRICGNYQGGWSRLGDGRYLCHPNEVGRPDCYRLVTVYGHPIPCKKCGPTRPGTIWELVWEPNGVFATYVPRDLSEGEARAIHLRQV